MGLWLLIAAFMLRALIPTGTMPKLDDADDGQSFALVLCSGSVPDAAVLREIGLPVQRDKPKDHGAACPFFGTGGMALASPVAPVLAIGWFLLLERLLPAMGVSGPALWRTAITARGPPTEMRTR
ncbi:hypothetical protein VPG91_01530 [Nitrospirillum amazonense]|uniref:hypothetical protein n=1 Tax=Nitrospirillum amazonense TaxID=28077 RepID=UPI002DD42C3A|nr:hypothetical protein [Nitrospirillum amazonense]MEC4589654.1 hypothetical protein [Nitrospirillum amazonense]